MVTILSTRFVVGISIFLTTVLMIGTTWNDSPSFSEAETLSQGYHLISYGVGLDSFTNIGAALIASAWLIIVSWFGGFSLCFLECSGLSGLSAWQDVQAILLVTRLPFIVTFVLAIVWLIDMVQRYTRSSLVAKISVILLCFSPTMLGFGGLIGSWSLSLLGTVIILDLFLKAQINSRLIHWILLGLYSAAIVFLIPMLWTVIFLLLVYWLIDWVFIQQKSANEKYFQTVGGILYWLIFSLGVIQIGYGFFTRGEDMYQWYLVDAWHWIFTLMNPEEVFLFGLWWARDWGGIHTVLSYALKEPFPILIFVAMLLGMSCVWMLRAQIWSRKWIIEHRFQVILIWLTLGLSMGAVVFAGVTGISSIWLPIALGYPLIALGIRHLLIPWKVSVWILLILGVWYVSIPFYTFPHYISHTNIFTGEGDFAYLAFNGSNIDAGQDLYRLARWTKAQDIGTIYIDYQGSIDPSVYLGDAYIPYSSEDGQKPNQYIAISVNSYHQSFREKKQGLRNQEYWWLEWKHPQAQIGNSIVIYQLPEHK